MILVALGATIATEYWDDRLRAAASNPALLATEVADFLVHQGVPFRQAHDLVGKLLREAGRQGKLWTEMTLDELQKISPHFTEDFQAGPSVESAIATKIVMGGTAIEPVRAAIAQLQNRLIKLELQ
jgi:argininosuccinate lyase